MERSILALKHEFTKIRSGRANPALLENVLVSYYGNDTPLKQVANIVVEDSRTLMVTPWEKNLVQAIEKAILTSDLGLNPATSGSAIRVPLPALNEERRREMVKITRNEAENAKVSVRNIRRDANNLAKELLKAKKISEDDAKRAEDSIQKLTDKFIKEIDQLLSHKEAELMEV
ncbi:MAG: ribosome recycling factor [Gammaproteobacteria bacterium]|nr:ribosome recycling factor [Gammaproteobacteria bacterium]